MYAIVSTVAYQLDNAPSEATARGFADLIVRQPGYRGRFGLDAGGGERVHIYVFDSVEDARAGLGGPAMHDYVEEYIRPHYAGPSARIGRGNVRHADFARALTGIYVRLAILSPAREPTLAHESGYLGHVALTTDDGQPLLAAILDATEETAGLPATRTWLGAVTVSDWRG